MTASPAMTPVPPGSRPDGISRMSTGCALLFATPFAAAGVFGAVQAIAAATRHQLSQALFLGIFGLVFGGVGFGLMILTLVGSRRGVQGAARLAAAPDRPWVSRADWASGRIEDSGRLAVWGTWAFAALWCLVAIPAGWFPLQHFLDDGNRVGLIGLVFPLAGLFLIWRALMLSAERSKFGRSVLELSSVPGVVGRGIGGTVHAGPRLIGAQRMSFSLSCIRRTVDRSGSSSSTSETVLWQDQSDGAIGRDGHGVFAPVAFVIPPDAAPSDGTTIIWRLEASAALPGLDYRATFEVPVYRTAESDAPAAAQAYREAVQTRLAEYRRPADSSIVFRPWQSGVELVFPAGRNRGPASGLTVFTIVWTAVSALLFVLPHALVFAIVFSLFDVLLVLGVVQYWFRSVRVTADPSEVVVESRMLGLRSLRRIPSATVADVAVRVGSQSGTRAFHDLSIVLNDGHRILAGGGIPQREEAEWLAARVKEAVKQ